MNEKLIVLDFMVQDITIHIFNITPDTEVDEDFIMRLGFDPTYCQWAFGTNIKIIEHKEILPSKL